MKVIFNDDLLLRMLSMHHFCAARKKYHHFGISRKNAACDIACWVSSDSTTVCPSAGPASAFPCLVAPIADGTRQSCPRWVFGRKLSKAMYDSFPIVRKPGALFVPRRLPPTFASCQDCLTLLLGVPEHLKHICQGPSAESW